IGCTFQQDPFVFYNVIDGNGGNGLRIDDSDNTTVQANFFGMGADNSTPVGNALDGTLIQGSSANTQFGGVIPLGNVVARNDRNGVEIADTPAGPSLLTRSADCRRSSSPPSATTSTASWSRRPAATTCFAPT